MGYQIIVKDSSVALHGKMYAKVLTDDIVYGLFVIHLIKAQVCLPSRTKLSFPAILILTQAC